MNNKMNEDYILGLISNTPNSNKYFPIEYLPDVPKEIITYKICLAAVSRNGQELKYVDEQTPEICLAAVKNDGWALEYVKEQTDEICLAAVKENSYVLKLVKKQTFEICLEALESFRKFNAKCAYCLDEEYIYSLIDENIKTKENMIFFMAIN